MILYSVLEDSNVCYTNKIAILQNLVQSTPIYCINFTDLGNR